MHRLYRGIEVKKDAKAEIAKLMTPELVAKITSTDDSRNYPAHTVLDWSTPNPIVFVTDIGLDYERKHAAESKAEFKRIMEKHPELKAKLTDAATQEEGLKQLVAGSLFVGRKLRVKDSERVVYVLGSAPVFKHEVELEVSCNFSPLTPYLHEMLGLGFIYPVGALFDPNRSYGLSGKQVGLPEWFKIREAFGRRKSAYRRKWLEALESGANPPLDEELHTAISRGVWPAVRLLAARQAETL